VQIRTEIRSSEKTLKSHAVVLVKDCVDKFLYVQRYIEELHAKLVERIKNEAALENRNYLYIFLSDLLWKQRHEWASL
jgi:hypothetical protein